MKHGAYTTEFWGMVLGVGVIVAHGAGLLTLSSVEEWAMSGLIGAYIGGRSGVKMVSALINARYSAQQNQESKG